MKRLFVLLFVLLISVQTFATKAVRATVTVSPATVSVFSGETQQFIATLAPAQTADDTVYWSCTAGTITKGLFTAPKVTTNLVVTIKAVRVGWPKEMSEAIVAVVAPVVQHSVDLSWNVDAGVVSYSVYRGTIGGAYDLLASALTETIYVDGTVVSNETYFYVVTATNTAGEESGYSNIAEAIVP